MIENLAIKILNQLKEQVESADLKTLSVGFDFENPNEIQRFAKLTELHLSLIKLLTITNTENYIKSSQVFTERINELTKEVEELKLKII
jgi:hypothetical protein